MSILVTGASGFIGLNLLETLLQKEVHVTAFSHDAIPVYALQKLQALPGTLTCLQGDISDAKTVQSLFSTRTITHVVHAATITASPTMPATQVQHVLNVNVIGTELLLRAAQAASVQRFLLISSSAVNGNAPFDQAPLDESSPTQPLALYGYTKLMTEQLANLWHQQTGLDVITARLTAIFGPWERDTGVRGTLSPPFQLALQALRGEATVICTAGQRDWTLSSDISNGLATLLFAQAPKHRLYNLASGELWHVRTFCQALAPLFPQWSWREDSDPSLSTLHYNDDLQRPRISPMRADRYSEEFGVHFTPSVQSVQQYAQWVLEHAPFLLT